jgi:type II secretory ATPase GspE/PulE/Tfp pilus assembly ATPase PilB-like protein
MPEEFEIIPKLTNITIDQNLIKKIPARLCKEYHIFPIEEDDSTIKLAMANPYDLQAIDDIQLLIKKKVKPAKTSKEEIDAAITKYYGLGASTMGLAEEETPGETAVAEKEEKEEIDIVEAAEDAVVVNFVNQMMQEAVKLRATDIHVEPIQKDIRIRYRIDGVLRTVPLPPQMRKYRHAIISRIKIMAKMDIAERRLPQDARIAIKTQNESFDLRVSTIPMIAGAESVAIRLLSKDSKMIESFDGLGMLPYTLDEIKKIIQLPNGIFLITGPTGSGKSTTLATILKAINTPDKNIITVEDPVEYEIPGVNQIQANERIGLTFANVLRNILRHDPNVIMIGEIRDPETAEIAMRAALTGHLVLSTLHTNDAPSAVTRLIDMGMEPFLVASTIRAVLAQRLVRKVCYNCKILYTPTQEEIQKYKIPVKENEKLQLAKGKGCDICGGTGYFGRTAIFELFIMNETIEDLVLKKMPASAIRAEARKSGMITLREDAWNKVKQGITTPEEVLRVTIGEYYL